MLEAPAQPCPLALRIFHPTQKNVVVFCTNVLISGTFDEREGGCFAFYFSSISLHFAFKPRMSHCAAPSFAHAVLCPSKTVPNRNCWVSLQLIRFNHDLQQYLCSQPSVAGCCVSHLEELHHVCNRDTLQSFFPVQLI